MKSRASLKSHPIPAMLVSRRLDLAPDTSVVAGEPGLTSEPRTRIP